MIDTHSHIYSGEFDADIEPVIQRAKEAGVEHIILPNVDSESLPRMLALENRFSGYCHAAIGLHPTSVNETFETELALIESELKRRDYIAIGEIGLDLYWDKTHLDKQIFCLEAQLNWSLAYNLPVIIHIRDAFDETLRVFEKYRNSGLRGVFHSFTGTYKQAVQLLSFPDFYLGINGIVTFKNAGLDKVIAQIGPDRLLLETDAPYLTPAPYRGTRNESAYTGIIAKKMAEIMEIDLKELNKITTENALKLFKMR